MKKVYKFLAIILCLQIICLNTVNVAYASERINQIESSDEIIEEPEEPVEKPEEPVEKPEEPSDKPEEPVEEPEEPVEESEEPVEKLEETEEQVGEPDASEEPAEELEEKPEILYQVHVQNIGWQDWKKDGEIAGTTGQSLQVEAVRIKLEGLEEEQDIEYRVHVQNIGWQDWKKNGEVAGTTGRKLQIEAIQIKISDKMAEKYEVCYCTHSAYLGWLGTARGNELSGSEAMGKQVEALKISLCEIQEVPDTTGRKFVKGYRNSDLIYSGHIQDIGDIGYVSGGGTLGTVGRKKRMEALQIVLNNSDENQLTGEISYQTHVQDVGWQEWKAEGEQAGTTGQAKRIEAIKIQLSGEISNYYNIYYRAHIENYGWLGWAMNGQAAGSESLSLRMEALQIKLVAKGEAAPGQNSGYFKNFPNVKSLNLNIIYQNPEFPNGCEAVALNNVMRYYGYYISNREMCYTYLPRGPLHSTNPYKAYMGDPGSRTGGYGCWAPVIVKTANNYFAAKKVNGRKATDVTGSSTDKLYHYIASGKPVVIWGTLNMGGTNWFLAGNADGKAVYWPNNAHCMVLTGYDLNRRVIKVNDPIRGKVEYSMSAFEKAYFLMGRNAVIIE